MKYSDLMPYLLKEIIKLTVRYRWVIMKYVVLTEINLQQTYKIREYEQIITVNKDIAD